LQALLQLYYMRCCVKSYQYVYTGAVAALLQALLQLYYMRCCVKSYQYVCVLFKRALLFEERVCSRRALSAGRPHPFSGFVKALLRLY
jgi:hypothetical protein